VFVLRTRKAVNDVGVAKPELALHGLQPPPNSTSRSQHTTTRWGSICIQCTSQGKEFLNHQKDFLEIRSRMRT